MVSIRNDGEVRLHRSNMVVLLIYPFTQTVETVCAQRQCTTVCAVNKAYYAQRLMPNQATRVLKVSSEKILEIKTKGGGDSQGRRVYG